MRKKAFAVLMAFVFVMYSVPLLADDLRDLRDQYDDARAEVQEQQEELAVTRAEIDRIYEELWILDERLVSAVEDLHSINQALYVTTVAMNQALADIAAAQEELDRQYDAIIGRLRDKQERGNMGLLSVLFQATSVRDFLLRLEYVNNLARHDREMVARLEASEARLTQMREAYVRQYDSVEVLRVRQQSYVYYLEHVEAEREAYFLALLDDEYRMEAMLALYREQAASAGAIWREAYEAEQRRQEEERLEREARLRAQQQAQTEAARAAMANLNGAFQWPVPSRTLADITSRFGPRIHPISRRQDNHSGLDIRASHGANIVAADCGVVIFSGRSGGYGITVIIDHGDGLHTLYAHNSRNLVNVGDHVTRGQVIALIGSTGVSTGPHLHFEVRVGGTAVDPEPFLGI